MHVKRKNQLNDFIKWTISLVVDQAESLLVWKDHKQHEWRCDRFTEDTSVHDFHICECASSENSRIYRVISVLIRDKRRPSHLIMHIPLCQSWYMCANDLVALSGSGSFIMLNSIGGGIMGQTIAYANEKAVSRIIEKKD